MKKLLSALVSAALIAIPLASFSTSVSAQATPTAQSAKPAKKAGKHKKHTRKAKHAKKAA